MSNQDSISTAGPIFSTLSDDEEMRDILEMFVDELPDQVSALQEALQSQDLSCLRDHAHQLKGAAGGYGFDIITEVAAELEASIKQNQITDLQQQVKQLISLCERATAEMPLDQ